MPDAIGYAAVCALIFAVCALIFALGWVTGSAYGRMRMRRDRTSGVGGVGGAPVPPSTQPLYSDGDPRSAHTAMQQALANAPELFARARRDEAIRRSMSCLVCGEGTTLICAACEGRYCYAHIDPDGGHECPSASTAPPGRDTLPLEPDDPTDPTEAA